MKQSPHVLIISTQTWNWTRTMFVGCDLTQRAAVCWVWTENSQDGSDEVSVALDDSAADAVRT